MIKAASLREEYVTMYNEDKKLISDIKRKKNTETNLKLYAEHVMRADYEYACQKFALNYFTVKEMDEESETFCDSYLYECITAVNMLTGKYILQDADEVSADDFLLIGSIKDKITAKMKVLTAYTDAFELYEYILNRKEFSYVENTNSKLEKEFADFDAYEFADKIFKYVFSDDDKVVINTKLKELIGQLPFRMTKNKFYDVIGQTLSIYKDCEKGSLQDFVETVESTALLRLPDGFDTEYDTLYETYCILKDADISNADYEEYCRVKGRLDESVAFINSTVSDYMMMIEIVNDLYAMMIANNIKSQLSAVCKDAINVIGVLHEAIDNNHDIPEVLYDMIADLEGAQEDAGDYKMMLEASLVDITQSCIDDISRFGYDKLYGNLDRLAGLLSGSLFVDVDNVSMYDSSICGTEYIVAEKDRLINEFGEVFASNNITYNRALMAKTLSGMPVFFNSQQEIKDYLENSLSHCSNVSELKACYMVINEMMGK